MNARFLTAACLLWSTIVGAVEPRIVIADALHRAEEYLATTKKVAAAYFVSSAMLEDSEGGRVWRIKYERKVPPGKTRDWFMVTVEMDGTCSLTIGKAGLR